MNQPDRIGRLEAYLARTLGEPAAFVAPAPGNSHDSWIFQVADSERRVLVRLEPDEGPFLHYDDEGEAALLRRLAGQGFPVPRVLSVEGSDLVGAGFLVLEWLDGDVINPRGAAMLAPAERRQRAEAMASMLARLHRVASDELIEPATADTRGGLTGMLAEFGRGLEQLRHVNVPVLEFVRVWIRSHAPRSLRQECVVHGDFRLGNLVWRGNEIVGILDWETARPADPLFDIAWMCMGATRESDLIMGLVTRDDFVALYERESGSSISRSQLTFWQVVAAWVRGCTEARLLDIALGTQPAARDARDLSWEFGGIRTDAELFDLIDAYEGAE